MVKRPAQDPQTRYAHIVKALTKDDGVTVGAEKKGFGSSALQVNGKIFAMLSSKGHFVVKLPRDRVDALVESGAGVRFDPGHGRVMKEWAVIDPSSKEPSSKDQWLSLAREAMRFVGSNK
jgi:hypothetical protein